MRRSEFNVTDKDAIDALLNECEYGVLSLIDKNEPYGLAVNYVYSNGVIYFHGSLEGRKVDAIKENEKASFLVVKPYSYIPSYFSDTTHACPATQFFASIHIDASVEQSKSLDEKIEVLTLLMNKMQPEGKFDPISKDNKAYAKMLEQTGVYKITPKNISLKVKVGQTLSDERKSKIVEYLKNRNETLDKETADKMLTI